jgi:Holliday junction DNA helicase RuvB
MALTLHSSNSPSSPQPNDASPSPAHLGKASTATPLTRPERHLPSDEANERTLRPATLDAFVGQTALKGSLTLAMQASQAKGDCLEHVLFYGPPGLGKTSLALLLATEMQRPCQLTSAPALEKPRDIVGLLMGLEPGTVLFIDEIHRLNRVTEELLYTAMEDFMLDRLVGKGASARSLRVPLPRFTLVGATTQVGRLSTPLRDRFGLVLRLAFYEADELTALLHTSAQRLGLQLSPQAAQRLAQCSRGTPRVANRLLRRVHDVALVKHMHQGTAPKGQTLPLGLAEVEEALTLLEVDPNGLDAADRTYLAVLKDHFGGGPAGLEAIASAMGEDARTLEDVVEPYLMQRGWLLRTPRGRQLSPLFLEQALA